MDSNQHRPRHAAWQGLLDALLTDHDVLITRLRERISKEIPTYRRLSAEELEADLCLQFEQVLQAARSGRMPRSSQQLDQLAGLGKQRARQGIPIEDMLRAWRIAIQITLDEAYRLGQRQGVEADQVIVFIDVLLRWSDVAMATTAQAHRRAELELARQDQDHRANLVHGILLGTLSAAEIRIQAEVYGLDPTHSYVAVRARARDDVSGRNLIQALGFSNGSGRPHGLSAALDGDLAGFLDRPPAGEFPGVVGVGPPQRLDRLAESFRLATRALITASSFGLTGVQHFAQLGVRPAIEADREVGEVFYRRYLQPIEGTSAAPEILATLRAYFARGLHMERTAQQLFIHPNTLRYRLGRFEELTGATLRNPLVAFEVWWALEHAAITPP